MAPKSRSRFHNCGYWRCWPTRKFGRWERWRCPCASATRRQAKRWTRWSAASWCAGAKEGRAYESSRNRELARLFEEIPQADVRRAALLLERLTSRIVNQNGRPEGIWLQCGIHLQKRCLVREAARSDCAWMQRKNRSKTRKHDSNEQSSRAPNALPAGGRSGVGSHGS